MGADQDDSAFVCIETRGLIISGGSKSGLWGFLKAESRDGPFDLLLNLLFLTEPN